MNQILGVQLNCTRDLPKVGLQTQKNSEEREDIRELFLKFPRTLEFSLICEPIGEVLVGWEVEQKIVSHT